MMKTSHIQQAIGALLLSFSFHSSHVLACAEHTEDGQAIHQLLSQTYDQPNLKVETAPMVIVGNYALLDWVQGENGGRALLKKENGEWSIVACGGDGFKNAKVLQAAGIPKSTAKQLIAELNEEEKDLNPERVQRFSVFGNTTMSHLK
jgi:hypothetical protein